MVENKNGRIYQLGQATGNVIESTGKGFSEATSGIPWWGKAAIIAGGVGVAGYLGYYLITQLTGPQGGSCTTPGTPCYEALQPYQQQYQTCASQYSSYLSQYLKEDSANGTGFTSAQLEQLNYLSNCMNEASANIAKTAKEFVPQNPLTVVSYFAGLALVTAVGLYFGSKGASILLKTRSYKVGVNNGFQAQQALNDAGIQTSVEDGTVSADEASGIKSQYGTMTQDNISYANQQVQAYYSDNIITSEDASNITDEMDSAMEADASETEDYLSSLFE